MADAEHPQTPDIPTWTPAFAALPLEAPPADAWSRVAASLPTATAASRRRRPLSHRMRWAMAAAIGVATLGGWMTLQMSRPSLQPVVAAGDGSAVTRHRTSDAMQPTDAATIAADTPAVAAGRAVASMPETIARASEAAPLPRSRRDVAARLQPTSVRRPVEAVATERQSGDDGFATSTTELASAARTAGMARALDELRGESARLEALVALARQSGLQSGPALVLTADIDDRVRLIDAALSQPSLDEAERVDLWRRRVDMLGELAAIEGTQRWMAAQGYSMDAVARVD